MLTKSFSFVGNKIEKGNTQKTSAVTKNKLKRKSSLERPLSHQLKSSFVKVVLECGGR